MSHLAEQTYHIVQAMLPDLPALVGGEAWPALAAELARLDAEWAAADDARRIGVAAAYRTALARHAPARQRLAAALRDGSLYEEVLAGVAALAQGLGDADGAAELRRLGGGGAARLLFLKEVGEPAKSVKLDNLEFDFGALSLAAAGILGAVATVVDPAAAGLSIGAAVLLILHELYKMMEREVSVDDASVFWGLVRAGGAAKQADTAAILAAANAARAGAYLEPLTETALRRSLRALKHLKAIAKVEGKADHWRIVENHRAVG